MSFSPAVILSNIPPSSRRNGASTATQILGSKTGVEVGVCYWKLHPTLPRFMVVFKHKKDRDSWYNTCATLKQMKCQGVSLSTVWYSRDLDKVVSEEENRKMMMDVPGSKGKKGGGGGNYMKVLEERDKNARTAEGPLPSSKHNMSALSAEIEDLDKLNNSFFRNSPNKVGISALSFKSIPNINELPPPVSSISSKLPMTSQFDLPPPIKSISSKVVRSEIEHVAKPKIPSSMNKSQSICVSPDFSVPPPPLRLPLHVQPGSIVSQDLIKEVPLQLEFKSNVLKKLEEFVLESIGQNKENETISIADAEILSKEVAFSWKKSSEQLERIYETVLSEEDTDVSKLTEELSKVNIWDGGNGVSKEQVMSWTKEFLVKVGMKTGSDTEKRFAKFLLKNNSQFKISIDEIKFIMERNGLDINQMCKAFSENSTSVGFKNFVKISVNIDGNLLDAFAGVFLDFFKSKIEEYTAKSARRDQILCSINLETRKSLKGRGDEVKDVSMDKVANLLAKKDVKAVKNIVNDLNTETKELVAKNNALLDEVHKLGLEKSKLVTEMKLNKEELHEKMRMANQENKVLRATNTSLHEQLNRIKEEKEQGSFKLEKILNLVNMMGDARKKGNADVDRILENNSEPEFYEVTKIRQALGNILVESNGQNEKRQSNKNVKMVKFVASAPASSLPPRRFVLNTNEEKKINADMVEVEFGSKILGIKFKQGKGKGWRFLKVEEGLINPPTNGWGDREYLVVAQDQDAGFTHGHLGQGCISTPGHSRRQDSDVRDGPMFPPHLGGPRISTS